MSAIGMLRQLTRCSFGTLLRSAPHPPSCRSEREC
jgi:hypothetical protein